MKQPPLPGAAKFQIVDCRSSSAFYFGMFSFRRWKPENVSGVSLILLGEQNGIVAYLQIDAYIVCNIHTLPAQREIGE